MSKRKKPMFENQEQENIWNLLNNISNNATRSEKSSWERKLKNMESLVDSANPIEQEIMVLNGKLQPIHDEISVLRKEMVDTCVHPFEMLIYKGNHVECKFCAMKINLHKPK